ncbi:hypothetical protein [Salininema proteolyticum]|uniref:Uncharacterized protein n=1 Tax=Salininema proteolyticum TaxID=1607685 RepID=A0ABV8U2L7_9ACTN
MTSLLKRPAVWIAGVYALLVMYGTYLEIRDVINGPYAISPGMHLFFACYPISGVLVSLRSMLDISVRGTADAIGTMLVAGVIQTVLIYRITAFFTRLFRRKDTQRSG